MHAGVPCRARLDRAYAMTPVEPAYGALRLAAASHGWKNAGSGAALLQTGHSPQYQTRARRWSPGWAYQRRAVAITTRMATSASASE